MKVSEKVRVELRHETLFLVRNEETRPTLRPLTKRSDIERNFNGVIGLIVDNSVSVNDIAFNKNNKNKYSIGDMIIEMKYGRNMGIFKVKKIEKKINR